MKKIISTLTICLTLLLPSIASAQFAIYNGPANENSTDGLTYKIKDSTSVTSHISVKNQSNSTIKLLVYSADALKNAQGDYSLKFKDSPRYNVGKWVTLDTNEIEIKPAEDKKVNFTLSIPKGTPPGNYIGGIAAETLPPSTKGGGGTGAIVNTRVVTPLYVYIPGEKITQYKIEQTKHILENNKHIFQFNFVNLGNTAVTFEPSITISGTLVDQETINSSPITLYKDDTVKYPTSWDKQPLFGLYKAKIEIKVFENDIITGNKVLVNIEKQEVSFIVIPWNIIVYVILVLLLTIFIIVVKKITHKKFLKTCNLYTVKENDTLMKIAEGCNVEWKKIAKINKIKPPFNLIVGQQILLPPNKK